MFIKTKYIDNTYTRASKLGHIHKYTRSSLIAVFECDNCNHIFERNVGHMDKRRLNNEYFHVCSNCDTKRFAQKKGVERRRIWNMSADTDIDISKL
jgi:transcription elongation factor Elf1